MQAVNVNEAPQWIDFEDRQPDVGQWVILNDTINTPTVRQWDSNLSVSACWSPLPKALIPLISKYQDEGRH